MSDPFRTSSKTQLLREAQIGLSVVAVLLVILVYVAFYRITGRGREIPEHVRNAPIAQTVWPNAISPQVAARRVVTTLEPSAVPEKEPIVDSVAGQRHAENNHHWATSHSIGQSVIPPGLKSNPISNGSKVAEQPVDQFPFLAEFKTQTSDTTQSLSKANRSETTETVQNWPNSSTKSIPSFTQPLSTTENNFQTPKSHLLDGKPPMTVGIASNNQSSTSEVAPAAFDNDLRNSIPVTTNRGPTSATLMDQSSRFPSSDSKPPIEPLVSVLDSASTASAEPGKREVNANAGLEPTDGDPKTQPTQSSSQPTLIAAKPIPFTNEFEFAKPLRQIPRNPAQITESQPKSIIQQPSVDPIESTAPKWTYRVEDGDSFWSIAEQVYGDGRFFRALYKYNEPLFPNFDDLTPGASLGTPSREDLIKLFPDACPKISSGNSAGEGDLISDSDTKTYVTQDGDTLFEIARQKLGQASRYLEIKEMNRLRLDSRVNHLTPLPKGVRLVLPFE